MVVAAGLILASALASYMQSRQADEMTASERQKMANLINAVQEPDFDFRTIQPEEFKLLEAYVPQAVPLVEEQAPEVVKRTRDMEEGRSAQMDALRFMRQMAAQGKDPIAEMDRLRGARQAALEANIQRQNIQAGMQRRGVGDSGLSLGLGQQAAGDAAYRTAMAGEEAARDAANRRMQAAGQASALGGQIFSQDESMEARNAAIINDFNQRMAARRQQLAQLNVGASNTAAAAAQAQRQEILNRNIAQRNEAARAEQDRQNALKQQQYNIHAGKAGQQVAQGAGTIGDIRTSSAGTQRAIAGAGQAGAGLVTALGGMYGKNNSSSEDEYIPEEEEGTTSLQRPKRMY